MFGKIWIVLGAVALIGSASKVGCGPGRRTLAVNARGMANYQTEIVMNDMFASSMSYTR